MASYRLGKLKGEWCVTWTEEGQRRRFRLGVSIKRPKADAQAALTDFVLSREAAETKKSGPLTLDQIFDLYRDKLRKEGKSDERAKWAWVALKPVFGGLTPDKVDIEIDVDTGGGKVERLTLCHRFAVLRAEKGIARDTIWSNLTTLRTAIKFAFDRNLITKRPYVWSPSKGAPRDVVAEESEVQRLISSCVMAHIRLYVMLAVSTGARKGAILDLTWDRVDFERRVIDFRAPIEKGILNKRGRKGRAVVEFAGLMEVALLEAKEYARSDFVIEYAGDRVKDIKKGLMAAVRRAGLEGRNITSHVLRHSVATWLADESIDMRQIQKMLGHDNIKTTERVYAKYRRGYLTSAANVIDLKLRGGAA